jgi:hypothetical protein
MSAPGFQRTSQASSFFLCVFVCSSLAAVCWHIGFISLFPTEALDEPRTRSAAHSCSDPGASAAQVHRLALRRLDQCAGQG